MAGTINLITITHHVDQSQRRASVLNIIFSLVSKLKASQISKLKQNPHRSTSIALRRIEDNTKNQGGGHGLSRAFIEVCNNKELDKRRQDQFTFAESQPAHLMQHPTS
jgi:hypothetical protein